MGNRPQDRFFGCAMCEKFHETVFVRAARLIDYDGGLRYNFCMIAIVDYGAGNIRSVINVLKRFNVDYTLAHKSATLFKADGIILPGVGAFGAAVETLDKLGLSGGIKEAARKEIPILGICLGLQLFLDESEESPGAKGLGLIPGKVTKLETDMKVPHIGWTSIENVKGRLLNGTKDGEYFYFVHSFAAHAANRSDVAATACYGQEYDACLERGNLFACQFHPEKSSDAGMKIIEKFLSFSGEEVK